VQNLFNFLFNFLYFCRKTVLDFGMFDQVRTDHGKEFVLIQFVQETLAHPRRNVDIDPHRQTESKHVRNNVSNIQCIRVLNSMFFAERINIKFLI
jgi:hypothetical protein